MRSSMSGKKRNIITSKRLPRELGKTNGSTYISLPIYVNDVNCASLENCDAFKYLFSQTYE